MASAGQAESCVIRYVVQNLRAVYGVPSARPVTDPLDVLIETILSQSTTDKNSGRAFDNLKRRFASWDDVRVARLSSIEAAIRCGGLSRQKSARIKELLRELYKQRGSLDLSFLCTCSLEEGVRFLRSFKGVGPKTVACTLLFACNRPIFPVDVHILRIVRRLELIPRNCNDEEAHRIMAELVPVERYYETHVNLIRHGRSVCKKRDPICHRCCLVEYCSFGQS